MVVITAENRAKYRIQQLILPLPGLNTKIPPYLEEPYEVCALVGSHV